MRVNAHILLAGACLVACGSCAPGFQGLYEFWNSQLVQGAAGGGTTHTIDDVSLLVGSPPTRCDTVVGPTKGLGVIALGIGMDPSGDVDWIVPGSVADRAGVPLHGRIVGTNGKVLQVTHTDTTNVGVRTSTRIGFEDDVVGVGVPVILNLADSQNITLMLPSAQWLQCYWRVGAGRVIQASGAASVTSLGGSASNSGTAYDRYFIVSGRFINRAMVQVSTNWQGQ